MLNRVTFNVCAVAVVGLCAGCQAQAPAGLAEADRAAIRQAFEGSIKAVNARDWAAFASNYAEDAVVLPPNEKAVVGRAAIQAWGAAFPPITDFQLQQIDLDGRSDLAYDRGTYSMNVTPPGAPGPIADQGKFVTVWQKQADGSWKIIRDIFNSDLPLPAPPPAPAKP